MNSERIALGVNAPTGGATFAAIAAQHLATEFAITRARRRTSKTAIGIKTPEATRCAYR